MINGAKEIKTAFITLLPIFLCACYRSSAPVVSDGSIEETGRENPAEADGREEDPNPDDPEIVDGAPDFPPVCPEGLADCAGLCVDLSSDPENCGRCNVACGADRICRAGSCIFECPEGLRSCDGTCVNLSTDPLHCGGCDNVCPDRPNAFPVCTEGECGIECEPGYMDCNGIPLDGCEPCDVGYPEECNGRDDDMDGAIDEDFECPAEWIQHCTNACAVDGLQECSAVDCTWGPCCSGEELCGNDCDDDCDGLADEGCP
jgi:hypothetical protein